MGQCTATAKATGQRCGRLANRGTTVCRVHGGNAPGVRAKAVERLTEEKARAELGKLAALLGPADPVEDPLRELLQLGGEARRWKELLAGRVAELTSVGYEGIAGEQLRAEVAVFERALDRLAGILATIARLNIDERLSKINESQADTLFKAAGVLFEWLNLDDRHQGQAKLVLAAAVQGKRHTVPRPDLYRVVEVVPPPKIERPMLEAPRAAPSAPFVVDAPVVPPPPPVSPPSAPPPAPSAEAPSPAAAGEVEEPSRPMLGREFWAPPGMPPRRPW